MPLSGAPQPEVTWTFNEAIIRTDDHRTITTDEDGTSLTIKKVVRDDTGEYSITAENELGSESVTFKVDVKGIILLLQPIYFFLFFIIATLNCTAGPPSPPQTLTVTDITEDACIIHWQQPEDDGGSPVLSYIVEKKEESQRSWKQVQQVYY